MDVDTLPSYLQNVSIKEDKADIFDVSGVISKLRETNKPLAENFKRFIESSVTDELKEEYERITDSIYNSEELYRASEDIEAYNPNNEDLVTFNDIQDRMVSVIDEMSTQFTLEEMVDILEVSSSHLAGNREYLEMMYMPVMEDTWGIDDETFKPNSEDEEEGYRDDELEEGEYLESDPSFIENMAGSEKELKNIESEIKQINNLEEKIYSEKKKEVKGKFDALTQNIALRKQLEDSLVFYNEFQEMSGKFSSPTFEQVLEGLMSGDNQDQARILYVFVSTLLKKLETMV